MPKVKMARKATTVDMTAMCDVAFLLLTFFMLATKFKPDEPVVVKTPSSISETQLQDTSIMLITIAPKDAKHPDERVFFSIDRKKVGLYDNADARKTLIDRMNEDRSLGLTDQEKGRFLNSASIGMPIGQLKSYLGQEAPKDFDMPGIPVDTNANAANNELAIWVNEARLANPFLRICIKADSDAGYPAVQKIISTLGGLKIFTFNLITNLEGVPAGTAAAKSAVIKSGTSK